MKKLYGYLKDLRKPQEPFKHGQGSFSNQQESAGIRHEPTGIQSSAPAPSIINSFLWGSSEVSIIFRKPHEPCRNAEGISRNPSGIDRGPQKTA
eukprot:9502407-Pyramimonas_sp.AAC.1